MFWRQSKALLTSLSELIFLSGPWPGAVLLMLLAVQPGLLVGGLGAWLGAIACAWLAGYNSKQALSGLLALNPFLSGMAVGYLVACGPACLGLAILMGAVTFLLSLALIKLFQGAALPALSLPFSLAAAMLWLVIKNYNVLPPNPANACLLPWAHPGLPAPIDGFLTALGSLVFLPHCLIGGILIALIAWQSRILLLCAVLGFCVHAGLRVLHGGDWDSLWSPGAGFNAILCSMAVGAVFLVPSWRSLLLGLLAAALSVLCADALANWSAWGYAGLPAFTIPFVLGTLLLIHLLRSAQSPLLVLRPCSTPEETLAEHWANLRRFPGCLRTLAPPFAGSWTVWQGHDGPWTHRGPWIHALDFVICDTAGSTYNNDGSRLEDYHVFGRPVLAPVSGHVVMLVDGLPDNAPGKGDPAQAWGNLVVIHDPRGFFVELSHFACKSIRVATGQWVERGQVLGLCGSSGHSPQPHLHLQVQAVATVGAATLPLSLVSWWDGERYQSNSSPRMGGSVEALPLDPKLTSAMSLHLDQELHFSCTRAGRRIRDITWRVGMADDGSWFLGSKHGCLHIGWHEGTFYTYRLEGRDPLLALLRLALPRLPLAQRQELLWEDVLPVLALGHSWRTLLSAFLGLFHPNFAVLRTRHHRSDPWNICGEVCSDGLVQKCNLAVEIDPEYGLKRICVDDFTLTRIHKEP